MLKIEFATENAAFQPDYEEFGYWEQNYYRTEEIKRVLKNVCNQLENGYVKGTCIDINGNKVGEWSLDE